MGYEITLKESGRKFKLKSLPWDVHGEFIETVLTADFNDPVKRRAAIRKLLSEHYGEKGFAALKNSSADVMQVYYGTMDLSNGNKLEEEEKNS